MLGAVAVAWARTALSERSPGTWTYLQGLPAANREHHSYFRRWVLRSGPALRWITSEVPMRKMTIRRTTALRLVSGARRLWIEWCW